MRERYIPSNDINHGCCWGASVVDTRNDQMICECDDLDAAKRIADALNVAEIDQ